MVKENIDAYDHIAETYAEKWNKSTANQPQRDAFLETLPSKAKILDAGCGTGRDLAAFKQAGYQPTGLDLSTNMLKQAEKQFNGPLIQGDLRTMPFEAEEFDAIWMSASLLHVESREAAQVLHEARRVTKHGGTLYISVTTEQNGFERQDDQGRHFTHWEPRNLDIAAAFAGWHTTKIFTSTENLQKIEWLHLYATAGN